ncbi:EscG/YscG/SsaH family type III secretion system needle protein co-chaperone [Chromobacterium sp. ATCC 53434]|uniref:EscG/YscG/SsaH family type III secretion system needle protein co-chaperone n=1 Tax=Chromobacterium TaxID=535 RepID=UPI000C761D7C|nr:EscG/YscG/SsaH family type III secretion system needle protein co-chaperone [Chromobacterium sp. ATCC 53434]AUH50665.1 EscG/YscG/SsaH family type III secretion system needle protein co-chaperone [Chromobacterium sp. ATCC 53434]
MKSLETNICKLVVETGLAAVNHGLYDEADSIRLAMPHLTENPHAQKIVEATLLLGMGHARAASSLLHGDRSEEAEMLRSLIKRIDEPQSRRLC